MKICYIGDISKPQVQRWAKSFIALGDEVNIISWKDAELKGAKVYFMPEAFNWDKKHMLKSVRSFIEVQKLIKDISPDILHGHEIEVCAAHVAGYRGCKRVLSGWGKLNIENTKVKDKLIKFAIKKVEWITSDSKGLTEDIYSIGCVKNRVLTLNMGVRKELLSLKQTCKDNEADLNIISLSPHEPEYRLPLLIDGFCEALRECSNLRLTIAAFGSQTKFLKNLVDRLGVSDKVDFIGYYNNHVPYELLKSQEVCFSLPSEEAVEEGMLECMAVGIFPIASGLEVNHDWIKDKKNGMILNSVTTDSVRDAILWSVRNKDKLSLASKKNKSLISAKGLWEKNFKLVKDLYSLKEA